MSTEHFLVTGILLGGMALACLAIISATALLVRRSERHLDRAGHEGRAALAYGLNEQSNRHTARLERRLHVVLKRMDAHIAMVLKRVDRDEA